jgi:hypothetical protein
MSRYFFQLSELEDDDTETPTRIVRPGRFIIREEKTVERDDTEQPGRDKDDTERPNTHTDTEEGQEGTEERFEDSDTDTGTDTDNGETSDTGTKEEENEEKEGGGGS